MFFFLLIILLVIFGLALLNIIGHIILWVFFAGLIIGGYGLLSQLDYKHLIAISFFLIALKLFIDSIRKSKK